MPSSPVTERTQLKRRASRGSHDRAVIDAILDDALVCHLGFTAPHGPVVLPTTHVRIGDHIYVHGSSASGMLTAAGSGVPACVTVTLLDGLVLAKTAFHHSVNYRSVVIFGEARAVSDDATKLRVFAALIDKVSPGRSAACRPPNAVEIAATLVLELSLAEASAKVRSGPPIADTGEDAALPYWAGVIPLVTTRGDPIPA